MDHQQWLEQHDRMIADHEVRHDRDMAELRASQAKTESTLRRAIRLSVQDAPRTRNAEFDVKMTQIAAAQLVNEELSKSNAELLKVFLQRGGNGKH
ncbi:MAG TPA: hypothetical protein VNY05_33705 [Candidatus Acidoferrales bacterium]|jgi:hypothetical protein|nr:hypothetical protein [Candidatus Acidoferrales bacterium]